MTLRSAEMPFVFKVEVSQFHSKIQRDVSGVTLVAGRILNLKQSGPRYVLNKRIFPTQYFRHSNKTRCKCGEGPQTKMLLVYVGTKQGIENIN